MKDGYATFSQLLYRALADLARQGFAAPIDEGVDLVQAFFAEEWGKLTESYKAASGSPSGYVYAAFVRFARRRIIRMNRWRQRLRDLQDMARNMPANSPDGPIEALIREETLEAIRGALARLDDVERKTLLGYIERGPRSERELARELDFSRYRVRETLVKAIGQLVVQAGAREVFSAPDWDVAVALWDEGRTIEETAGRLCRSEEDVRKARTRLVAELSRMLKAFPRPRADREPPPSPATLPGPPFTMESGPSSHS
jgi:RNA polymerase sigma factor (sigma-70 family)